MRRVNMLKTLQIAIFTFFALFGFTLTVSADPSSCALQQDDDAMLSCAGAALDKLIPQIYNTRWRDQSFREQAKILIRHGSVDKAMSLLPQISNEDTKALTIRAIGIGMAELPLAPAAQNEYFDTLHKQAMTISHTGSQEIAMTYIAIAEASAGLFERALTSARTLRTNSLRNKSYQEIAEVLSAKGDTDNSFAALNLIDDPSFRNKAYGVIAAVFIKHGQLAAALQFAEHIEDPYIKSNSFLNIMNTAE